MNSQDNSWSAPWWNEADTVSMFDHSLDDMQTLDGFYDMGESCFYLPPAIDSSDSDYSLGTCASPRDSYRDADDSGPWLAFSPASSVSTMGLPTETVDDTTTPEAWDHSSPPELRRDSSAVTDGGSCPSPASVDSAVNGRTTVKRLRSSGGVKKAKAKPRRESTGDSDRMSRHNLVEKKYRNRLNQQFELMITTLTEVGHGEMDGDKDRTLSKSAVLQLARQMLLNLDRKNKLLSREVERLGKEARLSQGMLVGQGAGRAPFLL